MIFTFFAAWLGFIIGFVFALGIVIFLLTWWSKNHQFKRRKQERHGQQFTYSTNSTMGWLNIVLERLYPQLIKEEILRPILDNVCEQIQNESQTINTLIIESYELSNNPPVIDCITLNTSLDGDFVQIHFRYFPKLIIEALSKVSTLIASIPLTLEASLDSIQGSFVLKIPENYGNAMFKISHSTSIEFNVGASLHRSLGISSETFGPIWSFIQEFVNKLIRGTKIPIKIEEKLYYENNNKNEKKKSTKSCVSIEIHTDKMLQPYVF